MGELQETNNNIANIQTSSNQLNDKAITFDYSIVIKLHYNIFQDKKKKDFMQLKSPVAIYILLFVN